MRSHDGQTLPDHDMFTGGLVEASGGGLAPRQGELLGRFRRSAAEVGAEEAQEGIPKVQGGR